MESQIGLLLTAAWERRPKRRLEQPGETFAAVGYGRNPIFGRQQRQLHSVRNSLSKGRNAGQATGNVEFVVYRRKTNSKMRAGVPDGHRPMLAKPCRGLTTSAQTRHASGEIDQAHTQVIDNRGKPGRTNQWYDPCWRQLGDGAAEPGDIRMTVQA